jgi:hypothetical protein
MSRLGFRISHSQFVTSHGPLYHSAVFQRLQWSRDVLVKLLVSVMDPFEPDVVLNHRVCLHAYFEPDGVHFGTRMHWDESDLPGNAPLFERLGPPFFEQFKSIEDLLAILHAAQAEFMLPEAYLRGPQPEPTDHVAREFLSLQPSIPRGPIPANEERLSLLYWYQGDIDRSMEHARRYLELIPNDQKMKARVSAMQRPII